MKIRDMIERQGRSISFEFFPPKSEEGEEQLFEAIRRLESFKPTFVSVTYGAGGGTLKNTRRVIKRIREETSLTPMPHLTCVDQSKEELRDILSDYLGLGIENILSLRGDPPKGTTMLVPKDGLCYASDLVQLAASFNAFSIGVAVYPEGHIEAPSLETDLFYTKQKIDAGADFAITQMFFENSFFYRFMERAQKAGIDIPIIPGIMPITDIEKIKKFSQKCGATLPAHLVERMQKAASPDEARKIGVDFAIGQCEDLMRNGIHYFHFYTLNRLEVVSEVLENLNLRLGQQEEYLHRALVGG
jgi:methylenetetrahydrofolate reductase (NADPH)